MVHSPDGLIDWIFPRGMTVEKLINDGLMVIFFFAVGLEIKREIVCGQLSSARQAILPVLAAAGGMLAPAIIFLFFNHGTISANGWGIPTATDIAFAIGILSMLGDRVPVSLKIFLTALAIADDLGAILVIALFYGGQVQISCLLAALVIMLAVYFMKEMGEKRMFFYLVPAVVVWGLFYYSGVHSAISGVAMAMLIPMTPRYSKEYFVHKMRHLKELMLAASTSGDDFPNEHHRFYMRRMRSLAADSVGMSYRLEHSLAPYVTFLVMPIFALANAGVEITSPEYLNIFHYSSEIGSIGMGIFLSLIHIWSTISPRPRRTKSRPLPRIWVSNLPMSSKFPSITISWCARYTNSDPPGRSVKHKGHPIGCPLYLRIALKILISSLRRIP